MRSVYRNERAVDFVRLRGALWVRHCSIITPGGEFVLVGQGWTLGLDRDGALSFLRVGGELRVRPVDYGTANIIAASDEHEEVVLILDGEAE